jgi:hypothetical protein
MIDHGGWAEDEDGQWIACGEVTTNCRHPFRDKLLWILIPLAVLALAYFL